jgi:hypothetical protein
MYRRCYFVATIWPARPAVRIVLESFLVGHSREQDRQDIYRQFLHAFGTIGRHEILGQARSREGTRNEDHQIPDADA